MSNKSEAIAKFSISTLERLRLIVYNKYNDTTKLYNQEEICCPYCGTNLYELRDEDYPWGLPTENEIVTAGINTKHKPYYSWKCPYCSKELEVTYDYTPEDPSVTNEQLIQKQYNILSKKTKISEQNYKVLSRQLGYFNCYFGLKQKVKELKNIINKSDS